MIHLQWELSVLSRAVGYPNLSAAAVHVSLSQPQLSRIVARIESELKITILDRSAKRKSAWTASAFKLAEIYASSARRLDTDIQTLVKQDEPELIRIGTLEGLSPAASACAQFLLQKSSIKKLHLDVHDLNALEELYLSGEMDLIFTSREPSRRKFKYLHLLGYQTLDVNVVSKSNLIRVYSTFEYNSKLKAEKETRYLVSNSLDLRKTWIQKHNGIGTIPSNLHKQAPNANAVKAFLIGSDILNSQLWNKVLESFN